MLLVKYYNDIPGDDEGNVNAASARVHTLAEAANVLLSIKPDYYQVISESAGEDWTDRVEIVAKHLRGAFREIGDNITKKALLRARNNRQ